MFCAECVNFLACRNTGVNVNDIIECAFFKQENYDYLGD